MTSVKKAPRGDEDADERVFAREGEERRESVGECAGLPVVVEPIHLVAARGVEGSLKAEGMKSEEEGGGELRIRRGWFISTINLCLPR